MKYFEKARLEVLILDDIYSGINGKLCKNSRREFVHLKNIDAKFYPSDYYDWAYEVLMHWAYEFGENENKIILSYNINT